MRPKAILETILYAEDIAAMRRLDHGAGGGSFTRRRALRRRRPRGARLERMNLADWLDKDHASSERYRMAASLCRVVAENGGSPLNLDPSRIPVSGSVTLDPAFSAADDGSGRREPMSYDLAAGVPLRMSVWVSTNPARPYPVPSSANTSASRSKTFNFGPPSTTETASEKPVKNSLPSEK